MFDERALTHFFKFLKAAVYIAIFIHTYMYVTYKKLLVHWSIICSKCKYDCKAFTWIKEQVLPKVTQYKQFNHLGEYYNSYSNNPAVVCQFE